MIILVIVVIAIAFFAFKMIKSDERERRAEAERQRIQEEADALCEKMDREIKQQQQETCDAMNEACQAEFRAWEERFCSGDNPVFRISGISHQGLTYKYVGAFKGLLKAEEWNAFDPKAVAIYWNRKKVGYIPKESSEKVFDMLDGGKLSCYGCIYRWYKINDSDELEENFAGKIVVV